MIKKLVVALLSAFFALGAFAANDNVPPASGQHHYRAAGDHHHRHIHKHRHHRHHVRHHHERAGSFAPSGR